MAAAPDFALLGSLVCVTCEATQGHAAASATRQPTRLPRTLCGVLVNVTKTSIVLQLAVDAASDADASDASATVPHAASASGGGRATTPAPGRHADSRRRSALPFVTIQRGKNRPLTVCEATEAGLAARRAVSAVDWAAAALPADGRAAAESLATALVRRHVAQNRVRLLPVGVDGGAAAVAVAPPAATAEAAARGAAPFAADDGSAAAETSPDGGAAAAAAVAAAAEAAADAEAVAASVAAAVRGWLGQPPSLAERSPGSAATAPASPAVVRARPPTAGASPVGTERAPQPERSEGACGSAADAAAADALCSAVTEVLRARVAQLLPSVATELNASIAAGVWGRQFGGLRGGEPDLRRRLSPFALRVHRTMTAIRRLYYLNVLCGLLGALLAGFEIGDLVAAPADDVKTELARLFNPDRSWLLLCCGPFLAAASVAMLFTGSRYSLPTARWRVFVLATLLLASFGAVVPLVVAIRAMANSRDLAGGTVGEFFSVQAQASTAELCRFQSQFRCSGFDPRFLCDPGTYYAAAVAGVPTAAPGNGSGSPGNQTAAPPQPTAAPLPRPVQYVSPDLMSEFRVHFELYCPRWCALASPAAAAAAARRPTLAPGVPSVFPTPGDRSCRDPLYDAVTAVAATHVIFALLTWFLAGVHELGRLAIILWYYARLREDAALAAAAEADALAAAVGALHAQEAATAGASAAAQVAAAPAQAGGRGDDGAVGGGTGSGVAQASSSVS